MSVSEDHGAAGGHTDMSGLCLHLGPWEHQAWRGVLSGTMSGSMLGSVHRFWAMSIDPVTTKGSADIQGVVSHLR